MKFFDWKYSIYLFKKSTGSIFLFLVLTVAATLLFVTQIPNRYQAQAKVILEKPLAGAPGESSGQEDYNIEMEIMRSKGVLMQVVQNLNLKEPLGAGNEEEAAARVRDLLSVRRSGTSRMIHLTVTAEDPQLAADLANAVARATIRKYFENALVDFEGARAAIVLETLPALKTDPTIRQLRQRQSALEAEMQEMTRHYRDKHPLLIKARANYKFLQDKIEEEKRRVIETLKSQTGQPRFGAMRLVEEARVPKKPLPKEYTRMAALGAWAALFLSFGAILLRDYFDHTIHNVEDLERKGVALPFLGHVPLIKNNKWKRSNKHAVSVHQDASELGEAFRYIRVAINFSGSPESMKQLLFSSCLPHEGKSFVAHHIALSLASDGNHTLLVDADLRRPTVHKRFAVDNAVGLSNFLKDKLEFESVLKGSPIENLTLAVSGPVCTNPVEILGSPKMKQFLAQAAQQFDRVIIDCPSLTGIGDSYALGSQAGPMILVIAAGQISADLIKHHQKRLEKAKIQIMGVILNRIDMEKERFGGYYQSYRHTHSPYNS